MGEQRLSHPNAHTPLEIKSIRDYMRRNPHISLPELYGKLRIHKAYRRHPASLYRCMRKLGYFKPATKKSTKYVPKPYDTPTRVGVKWQLDVKFVPTACYTGTIPQKFYQYTVIDEASRERFICPYLEQSSYSTVDFMKRAFTYFGYQPSIVQTDNGSEFTHIKKTDRVHPLDLFLQPLGIINSFVLAHLDIMER
jgi:transposase InsO family protein